MSNPFSSAFESFGAPRGPLVEKVHQGPFEFLTSLLKDGEGQLITLRAPRAGYGKTMLLSRLQLSQEAQAVFIPIRLADGRRVEGEMILEEILTQMLEVLPAGGGLTRLDLCARKLFAQGMLPMVHSGEVPCQDRDGALRSLQNRPVESFNFYDEGAVIAQWSRDQYALLGPRLSAILSKASGAAGRDTNYWTDLFFNYATRYPSDVSRTSDLMETVLGESSRFRSGAGFLEGLSALINMITLVEPMVMVLDEVDGLSSDSDSALRAVSCLTSLWESAPRLSMILSINDDVWDSTFVPGLPLGLKDRLEDVIVRLDLLSQEEVRDLVIARAGDEAFNVLPHLFLDHDELYPRAIIRKARAAWEKRHQPVSSAPWFQHSERAESHPSAGLPDELDSGMTPDVVSMPSAPAGPETSFSPPPKSQPAPVSRPPEVNEPTVQQVVSPSTVDSNIAPQAKITKPQPPQILPPRQPSLEGSPFSNKSGPSQAPAPLVSPFVQASPDPQQVAPLNTPQEQLAADADAVDDLLKQFRNRND